MVCYHLEMAIDSYLLNLTRDYAEGDATLLQGTRLT
jgi:hypothetical protein